ALPSIKGIGGRFTNIVYKKADVDMNKRAGELSAAKIDNLMVIVSNPRQFKIHHWFLNRKKDYKDGKYSLVTSNALDMKLRDDLERLKKIRNHRGLRHYWGLRVPALPSIKGIGGRFTNIVYKKADVDMNKRAGELSAAKIDNLMVIVSNPRQFKIHHWFLNRKKDYKDGKYSLVTSNALDMKLRDDLERLKKIRNHRGLRHYWGLRVRG
ncbi:unnamed protein product, partial [Ilex paraguariensis]